MKKLSDLVTELTETWWNWMQAHELANDKSKPYSLRSQAAKDCEELIKQEYKITGEIDKIFQ
jgi:hypothetical protein